MSCAPFCAASAAAIIIQHIQTPHNACPPQIFIPINIIARVPGAEFGYTNVIYYADICMENRPWQPSPTLRIFGPEPRGFKFLYNTFTLPQ